MSNVDKVIKVEEAEVGYMEKASPKDLDDKTKNAGYNNYTKFGRDLVEWVGAPFADGYSWCEAFQMWSFIKAFGKATAKKMLGGWTAYCPTAVQYFKDMKRWYKSPKKGDLIFFYDSDKDYGHVGLVYKVDSNRVYTIEGNTSPQTGVVYNGGGVYKKKYDINYYRIAGYGRPDYSVKVEDEPKPEPKPTKPTKKGYTGTFPKVPPILKYGSEGTQVKNLQKFLNWYGNYGLDVDGIFGKNTEKAVKAFQKKVKISIDGEFGPISLKEAKAVKK